MPVAGRRCPPPLDLTALGVVPIRSSTRRHRAARRCPPCRHRRPPPDRRDLAGQRPDVRRDRRRAIRRRRRRDPRLRPRHPDQHLAATPTRVQDMLIATAGKDTWYPGVGQSQSGILHVVYTQSSARARACPRIDRYQLPVRRDTTPERRREIADGGAVALHRRPLGRLRRRGPGPARHERGLAGQPVHEVGRDVGHPRQRAPDRRLDVRRRSRRSGSSTHACNVGTTGAFPSSVPKTRRHRRPARHPEQRRGDHRQPDVVGQQGPATPSLTPLPIAEPGDLDDQLPARRQPGNNLTSPLSNGGGVEHHVQGRRRPGGPLHPRRHRLLPERQHRRRPTSVLTPFRVLDTAGRHRPRQQVPGQRQPARSRWPASGRSRRRRGDHRQPDGHRPDRGGLRHLSPPTPPPTNPTTSTINFPLGDTRANGVTVKLSGTGTLSAVYKAPPGKSDPPHLRRHRLLRRRPHRGAVRAAHSGSPDGHPVRGPAGGR